MSLHPDDLPGYLVDAIELAAKSGLSSLRIQRVGTSTLMWQASSRFVGDDAYRVAIEADPFDALLGVLGPRHVPSAPPVSPSAAEDLFA